MAKSADAIDAGFTIVSKKKSSKRQQVFNNILKQDENIALHGYNKSTVIRRILTAKEEILESDFYSSLQATLREALEIIGNPEIKEIVSYGLGHVSDCMISRYQLALLICLKEQFKTVTFVYDPVFTTIEKEILEDLGCVLVTVNEEGKRKILTNTPTLLYFPHCPKQLVNNFLYENWSSKNLKECIIIGNSFSKIIESTPTRILREEAEFILNISPYVDELYVINTFKFIEFFNDTSIHIFQEDKLKLIIPDFWLNRKEPEYNLNNIEIILDNQLKIS